MHCIVNSLIFSLICVKNHIEYIEIEEVKWRKKNVSRNKNKFSNDNITFWHFDHIILLNANECHVCILQWSDHMFIF